MLDQIGFTLAAKRILLKVSRLVRRTVGHNKTTYVGDRVSEYREYWKVAADVLSASFSDITHGVWEIRRGRDRTRIANHVTEADDPVTLELAGNKVYCIELARSLRVPVAARGAYNLNELHKAQVVVQTNDCAWVVKPASGSSSGLGITTQIRTKSELEHAFLLASLYDRTILLERFVPAEACRLLFLEGRMIHAVRRAGQRVVGDSRSSILHLLRQLDENISNDDDIVREVLANQNLHLDSVPAENKSVVVRHLSVEQDTGKEHRTVYDETITGQVGAALENQLAALVQVLRCNFAGVDVLTNDVSLPLEETGGVFLEINTTPGIHHHYIDENGKNSPPVAVPVLEYLLSGHTQAATRKH